jgi:hypothetical protein
MAQTRRLFFKLGLAAALILGAWICIPRVALFFTSEPRLTAWVFRYLPGDAHYSHAAVHIVDMRSMGDLRLEPDAVIFAYPNTMKISDTAHFFGFVGQDHLGAEMRLSTAGSDLSRVRAGPRTWEWLYRPSTIGRVSFRIDSFGPDEFPGVGFTMETDVRDRLGLTTKQQLVVEMAQYTLSAMGILVGIWTAFRGKVAKSN